MPKRRNKSLNKNQIPTKSSKHEKKSIDKSATESITTRVEEASEHEDFEGELNYFNTDFKSQSNYYYCLISELENELKGINKALSDSQKQRQAVRALKDLVEGCADEIINEYFDTWFSRLQNIIEQKKVGTEALVTMTTLLKRPPTTHNNLLLSKQLNHLITIVTSNPNNFIEQKFQLLEACVDNYTSLVLHSKAKLDKFAWSHMQSELHSVQQKACSLLVSSSEVTPGRNSRGDLIKEVITMTTTQLTSLLDPLFTPDDLSPHLNHFTSLMFLLNTTLSRPSKHHVIIPVSDVINLVGNILNHRMKGNKQSWHTHHLHQLAYELLTCLITCCKQGLFLHGELIHNYFTQSFIDIQTLHNQPPLYSKLRGSLYNCIKTAFSFNILPSDVSSLRKFVDCCLLEFNHPIFNPPSKLSTQQSLMSIVVGSKVKAGRNKDALQGNQVLHCKVRCPRHHEDMLVQMMLALAGLATCDFSSLQGVSPSYVTTLLQRVWDVVVDVLLQRRLESLLLLRAAFHLVCALVPSFTRSRRYEDVRVFLWQSCENEEDFEIRQLCKMTYHHLSSRPSHPCVPANDSVTSLSHGGLGGSLDTGFGALREEQKDIGDAVELNDGGVQGSNEGFMEGSNEGFMEGSRDDTSKVGQSSVEVGVETSAQCEVVDDSNGNDTKHATNESRPDVEMVEKDDVVENIDSKKSTDDDQQNTAQTVVCVPDNELNEEKNDSNSEGLNSKLVDSDSGESNEEEVEEISEDLQKRIASFSDNFIID